ncbi:MAG TPA: lysophospholipid acyltransferase family protein [Gemmatimonadaceae bacterium]|nr:lysophospholipid acyltransferase family protein [Gemmatimonadaceae bacterium]
MNAATEQATSSAATSSARPQRRAPTMAHRAEYAALRATLGALSRLPWSKASDVGARLGLLGFRPLGIRRDVVVRQIADSFPELDRASVERIARGAYESLGRTTVEAAVLPTLGPGGVLDLFAECEGWEVVEEARAGGRGIIFVAGHLGNWELGGAYLAARGIPLDAIARGQGNPLFDAYITETRTRLGMTVVHDADAVRRTPRSIKQGRSVAFLMDQGVLGLASTFVDFFGRPAKTPRGPAVFALRLDAPVVFAAPLRLPDNRFRMVLERVPVAVTGDRERDVDGIVDSYTRVLEKWVRRAPAQYFWHHRRWKHAPPAGWSGTEGV